MNSVIFYDYEVYENGTIINLKTGNEMTPVIKDNKRKEIRLTLDGVRKHFIVARLVYWVFNPDFDITNKNLCVVVNDDKVNFTLSDLKVVNRKDLIQGEKHKNIAKLTDSQADEIRAMYAGKMCVNQYDKAGISYSDLASKYGVTKANIAQIIRGEARSKKNYILK